MARYKFHFSNSSLLNKIHPRETSKKGVATGVLHQKIESKRGTETANQIHEQK